MLIEKDKQWKTPVELKDEVMSVREGLSEDGDMRGVGEVWEDSGEGGGDWHP